ncbi:MAG: Mth938-like domain-containing protein [Rhodomicrobiaceae bacterium]
MDLAAPILPTPAPISGYGRGGFRVGGIEHRGSLLILPDGVYPWPVGGFEQVSATTLAPVLGGGASLGFLILGTGPAQIFPAPDLRRAFDDAGLGLEAMDTGAACRTYNILLSEERVFAAALLALS